ncbi:MAG TPA: DUF3014 domain-containing protein [Thermodesulfobacteriota bacterium]|nr:DUF3014 domain-containing protein [Thermodesulfobacteriota bacterium]
MESQNKSILITAAVLVLLLLGAGVLYWYYTRPPATPPAIEQPKAEAPSQPPPSAEVKVGEEKEAPPQPEVKIPALDQSDDFVRQMMKNLSPHGKLGEWLKIKNIIRVFVAAVDNIANGKSPRPQLGFLSPGQAFPVGEKGDRIYLDPKGYERFDIITDAIVSFSSSRTVQGYQKLRPLFQEAYRELGYPQKDFHATFIQAMKRIMDTPIVEREVLLKEEGKGLNYVFIDDGLENMSEVQKHLLRMGPKNTKKIQQKVREIALALGVPETQLPQAQIYIPRAQ